VFCQLEVLRHCFPSSVQHILDELPESLDETYERILREIRKPKQRHAHRLLQCLVAAVRPLRVEELAEVLAFDFIAEGTPKLNVGWRWENQEEAVMSACSSLVIIVKDGDSRIVQFSHFSVKEFLTANRLAEPIKDVSRYHIRLDAAHTILARACLGVLLQLDDRVRLDSIKNFPLARYAAQYWPTHARFENASSLIKDGMECLFDADKPHFAAWLWVYDEDQDVSAFAMRPEKPKGVPLYYAAMLGFRDLVDHLIAEHPEYVNGKGGRQVSPMHIAAEAGHADILSSLLEHGADLDGRDGFDQTPLLRASHKGKLEAGRCLLDRGADINARNGSRATPLFEAVYFGHVEFARMLLERGARINDHCSKGMTPLHRAVKNGSIEAVRLLLEHGADVSARDKSSATPSQRASQMGYQEIVKLLSEYGAESVK
jgi:Ankyrin repeats (many copies)/Ankyrin repeats (3 copies)